MSSIFLVCVQSESKESTADDARDGKDDYEAPSLPNLSSTEIDEDISTLTSTLGAGLISLMEFACSPSIAFPLRQIACAVGSEGVSVLLRVPGVKAPSLLGPLLASLCKVCASAYFPLYYDYVVCM